MTQPAFRTFYRNARMTQHYALIMSDRPRGKPEAFTDEENDAMRASLRELFAEYLAKGRIGNQTQFAELIGVVQQTAGKLLGKKRYGFSRPTALAFAILRGYDSPEALLDDLGKKADPAAAPLGWLDRDFAIKHARAVGYDEEVISLVTARYAESQYSNRPRRWWMDRIVQLQQEIDAEKKIARGPDSQPRQVAAAPVSTAPQPMTDVYPRAAGRKKRA